MDGTRHFGMVGPGSRARSAADAIPRRSNSRTAAARLVRASNWKSSVNEPRRLCALRSSQLGVLYYRLCVLGAEAGGGTGTGVTLGSRSAGSLSSRGA
jgi:hypothetical protein